MAGDGGVVGGSTSGGVVFPFSWSYDFPAKKRKRKIFFSLILSTFALGLFVMDGLK